MLFENKIFFDISINHPFLLRFNNANFFYYYFHDSCWLQGTVWLYSAINFGMKKNIQCIQTYSSLSAEWWPITMWKTDIHNRFSHVLSGTVLYSGTRSGTVPDSRIVLERLRVPETFPEWFWNPGKWSPFHPFHLLQLLFRCYIKAQIVKQLHLTNIKKIDSPSPHDSSNNKGFVLFLQRQVP